MKKLKKLSYSVPDAAVLLSVGVSHIKKFTNSGELRSFKLGNRRLISHTAIEEFLRYLEERGYTETPKGEQS